MDREVDALRERPLDELIPFDGGDLRPLAQHLLGLDALVVVGVVTLVGEEPGEHERADEQHDQHGEVRPIGLHALECRRDQAGRLLAALTPRGQQK